MLTGASKCRVATLAAVLLVSISSAGCRPSSGESAGATLGPDEFKARVEAQEGLVIVDFWATWCGPCLKMKPVFKKLAGEYKGRVGFVEVDVDANRDLASRFNVRSIPLFVAFKDGKVVGKRVGSIPEKDFRAWIEEQIR